jgi:DNA-binding MarR family transcriptional regulator/predicted GNAT family acetyltransferase
MLLFIEGNMTELIRKLGELATASRIKRLSESLMQDVGRIYKEQGFDFEPKWFLIFFQLSQQKAMSVTELAKAVGITYPAVNQLAAEMAGSGLVDSKSDPKDKRKRLISLTEKGRALMPSIKPLWKVIETSTSELLGELDCNFLQMIGQIEDALEDKSMYQRVANKIKSRQYKEVDIVEFKKKYKEPFYQLNKQWLEEYFTVEPADERMLLHPEANIIKPGGKILFAIIDAKAIGTVALINKGKDKYELAKLAVAPEFRGRMVGKKLVLAAIKESKALKAKILLVRTNPRLDSANRLYRSLGFKYSGNDRSGDYQRPTIIMNLNLK